MSLNQLFSRTKPVEQLFDLSSDPHETVNLAGNQEYKSCPSFTPQPFEPDENECNP